MPPATAPAIAKIALACSDKNDVVSASNLNRQLVALNSTVGKLKVEVMAERIADINPQCELNLITDFLTPESIPDTLK